MPRKVTFHGLHHSHATMLVYQGENPKDIQARLGHSTISITMDLYVQAIEDARERISDRPETTLGGTLAAAKAKDGRKMAQRKGGGQT